MKRGLAAVLAVAAGLLVSLPAGAAPDGAGSRQGAPRAGSLLVQELNFVFIPDPAQVTAGQVVRWKNATFNRHTTTGTAPLSLWDSGDMFVRQTFEFTFTAAGVYPYTCTLHEIYDMVSEVRVKGRALPPSGPVGTVFTVTVATVPAPADYVYDVQKQDPGGQWLDWMTGLSSGTVEFDSTGQTPGNYRFRSRLHRVSDDASSNYSPSSAISVTP